MLKVYNLDFIKPSKKTNLDFRIGYRRGQIDPYDWWEEGEDWMILL